MNPKVQIFAVIGTVLVAVFVLELVRKRKLREEYSLVWLCAIVCLGILAFDRPLVAGLADLLGIAYAPTALFVAGFAVVFLLLLNFSVAISRLVERNKRLTQEVGLLRSRLAEDESVWQVSPQSAAPRMETTDQ
jgi:hypothetical protein